MATWLGVVPCITQEPKHNVGHDIIFSLEKPIPVTLSQVMTVVSGCLGGNDYGGEELRLTGWVVKTLNRVLRLHIKSKSYITTGSKHKACGPNPALHLVLSGLARVSTWQQHRALAELLGSSYIYTALKLHLALWRQSQGWCDPWWKWVWRPWSRPSVSVGPSLCGLQAVLTMHVSRLPWCTGVEAIHLVTLTHVMLLLSLLCWLLNPHFPKRSPADLRLSNANLSFS